MKLKLFVLILSLAYIITGVITIPAGNKKFIKTQELCIGVPDKILTKEPSGIELYNPLLKFHSKTRRHIIKSHPFESEETMASIIIPVLPLVSYYQFDLETDGFRCGGNGLMYIWFNGIKFKEREFFMQH